MCSGLKAEHGLRHPNCSCWLCDLNLGLAQELQELNDRRPCSCFRVDAGKVELDGAQYAGFALPFSITQLVWIEALAVGGAEVYRNAELNPEKRIYPGVF